MRRASIFLLAVAALVHVGMLVGWRWPRQLTPYFFDATVLSGGRGLDFYAIYQAGYNARHGIDIYEGDPAKAPVVVPYFTPYRYLPVVAYTLGAALSLFSPLTAYKIWVVVIELTLLGCVLLTWRITRDFDRFALLASMWLCFTPFYLELFMGQFSLVQGALIFGMLAAAPLLAGERSEAQSETGWGLWEPLWLTSILWKINTIVFAPVLLRLRRFRILTITAVVLSLTTIPYFLVFPAHARDFLVNNFGDSVTHYELGNLGFRQFVFELLAALGASPAAQRLAQLAVVVIAAGSALLITFYFLDGQLGIGTWELPPGKIARLLSLWLTAFFLVSPQIWEHHYVMLLPVLVIEYWRNPNWFVLFIWLWLALPTPFGFIGLQSVIAANHDLRAFPLEPAWQPLLQHASKALPTLALFAYLAWRGMTQGINRIERVV